MPIAFRPVSEPNATTGRRARVTHGACSLEGWAQTASVDLDAGWSIARAQLRLWPPLVSQPSSKYHCAPR
jgi:hypothetical protein